MNTAYKISQLKKTESVSVFELSTECSSNTTSYLTATLIDEKLNRALLSANILCTSGSMVKKVSEPWLLGYQDSVQIVIKGLLINY